MKCVEGKIIQIDPDHAYSVGVTMLVGSQVIATRTYAEDKLH